MWQLYTFERVCKHFCVKLFENFSQAVFFSRHMLTLKHDSPFKSSVKSMMSVNTNPPPKPLVI